jgi:hypothetical protein
MRTQPSNEDVLWTLRKDARTAEARIGTAVTGGGQPELRIYTRTQDKSAFEMLFCQALKDMRGARALADEKKLEFVAQGWR